MSPINSTMQGFYWGGIIILILIIAASIWLLARGGGIVCDNKGKLNESCSDIGDCNSGLVCSVSPGGDGVCKVASGGVCETASECGSNLTCQNGTCQGRAGGLNDPCPCGEGFTCVNNVCKVKVGGPCMASADCADSNCVANVCMVPNPIIAAAQAAGITNLTDLVAAAQNAGLVTKLRDHRCSDSNCDCDRYSDRTSMSDDRKYYYDDSDSYSDYHKRKRSDKHCNSSYSSRSDSSRSNSSRSDSSKSDRSRSDRSISDRSKSRSRKVSDTDSKSRYYGTSTSSDQPYSSSSYKSSRSKSSKSGKSGSGTSDTSCYKSSNSSCSDTHSKRRH